MARAFHHVVQDAQQHARLVPDAQMRVLDAAMYALVHAALDAVPNLQHVQDAQLCALRNVAVFATVTAAVMRAPQDVAIIVVPAAIINAKTFVVDHVPRVVARYALLRVKINAKTDAARHAVIVVAQPALVAILVAQHINQ